jgi:hypothetical protein
VAVFLVHAQERELEICLSQDATGKRIPMTHGFAGFVARTGQTVNVPDARKDERFDSATDSQTGFRTKSVLCCPILDSSGRVIGVIQALNKLTGRKSSEAHVSSPASLNGGREEDYAAQAFSDDDQELLEMLTQSAGVTLQNAQLLQAAVHAKTTTRALLRLVQQIVGEGDFIKLDLLLRASCKQLLDCERCIVAWISRTDNTLRIFLDDHQTLSIPCDDPDSIEAKLCRAGGLSNFLQYAESKITSRYEERTGQKMESVLVVPIAGGMQGPLAFIMALNKLEQESSLAHASTPVSASSKRISRAYKPFSKEDESDMLLFCSEVEGALRVKRNLQMDFNNLLLEEAAAVEDNSSNPSAPQMMDSQQKRLMMLYSGFDTSQKQLSTSSSSLGSSKGVKRTAKEREEESAEPGAPVVLQEDEDLVKTLGSPRSASRAEHESKSMVELTLSDCLTLDVIGQPLDTCRSWSLSLLLSDMSVLKQCGVDVRKMPRFVAEVQDHYNNNPFHNFYHAFAVLHTAHDLVKRTVEGRKLDPICALSILLASFCQYVSQITQLTMRLT